MGCIYIIKNTVNDKVYIGQTIFTVAIRYKQHLDCVKDGTTKLYRAMRAIGADKFYVERLEEVDNTDLNSREDYYITLYNSIENGYNSILNSDNIVRESIKNISTVLDDICKDYLEGMSFTNLSIKYDMSINTLSKLVKELVGLRINDTKTSNNSSSYKQIVMYDTAFNPILLFNSVREAYNWLCKNSDMHIDLRNTYAYTKRACGCGNIAYGHRWQLASDLVYDDKIFRTKFDKEAYIQGKPAYQPEGKKYYIVDGALDSVFNKYTTKIKRCKICNIVIDPGASLCRDCYNKQISANIPDMETLQLLILKYSYEEIGRQYGVTGKAVRKWCDKYGLVVSGERDSSGVTCVELNMHFNTFKEAAEYVYEYGYTSSTDFGHIGYNISKAKKNNKKYLSLTWI